MSVSLHAASGPPPKKAAPPEIVRRSANYHPCVWGDHFLAYNTPDHSTPDKDTVQKMQVLKEEVKNMLLEAANNNQPQQQLRLMDDIQRLGVAYHFQVEIDTALKRLNDMYHQLCGTKNNKDDDLGIVSLCFRLLRQHGYNVSSGVFNKYKDESSGTFNECLSKDVEGLLSLYEATHLRVHGEDILDEALAFATSYLKSLKTDPPSKSALAARVLHALELPVWKSLNRIEARHHISVYQDKDSHSASLLHFAKLDFNVLQKLYQRELGEITSWWKNLNVKEKYPFARDRSVECYFWSLSMSFEPQYQLARRILTKAVCLIVILDDVYDVYGTIEELTLLTDAIQRLDASALDQLPEYMRHIYRGLLQFYAELEEELGKAGIPLSRAQYAKDAMKEITRSYIFEAKCINKWLSPTLEEYMPHSLTATVVPLLVTHFLAGMGNMVTTEVFKWVSTHPLLIRAASLICRLIDDMAEHEAGKAEDTAYLVDYYMKQHGVSKEYTCSEFEKQKVKAYKDMNSECLHPPPSVPFSPPLFSVFLGIPRGAFVLYEYQGIDGFTSSDTKTKQLISSLLVHPIPI